MSERGRLKINSNERLIMSEFSVKQWRGNGNYYISDSVKSGNYLHRDGEVVNSAAEYWRTREEAEAVLEKFYPEPKGLPQRKWKHGDVFFGGGCGSKRPKIYIHIKGKKPQVFHLFCPENGNQGLEACGDVKSYTEWSDATFLFNIKDKL